MAAAEYRTVTSSRIFLISISLSFSCLSKKPGNAQAPNMRRIEAYWRRFWRNICMQGEPCHDAAQKFCAAFRALPVQHGRRARPGQDHRRQRQHNEGDCDIAGVMEQ